MHDVTNLDAILLMAAIFMVAWIAFALGGALYLGLKWTKTPPKVTSRDLTVIACLIAYGLAVGSGSNPVVTVTFWLIVARASIGLWRGVRRSSPQARPSR